MTFFHIAKFDESQWKAHGTDNDGESRVRKYFQHGILRRRDRYRCHIFQFPRMQQ
jgi:hypothetical protein